MTANLQTMLMLARMKLGDLSVRKYPEPMLVMAANEGKNELVKIIRQACENFFETETTGALTVASPPNPTDITLPSDFSQLRDIEITDSGFEDIGFVYKNHSDIEFKQALIDGGSFANGQGSFYYDILGLSTMRLSPGADMALNYKLHYIKTIPDMELPTDIPIGIPPEDWDFIVTWMICDGMRNTQDPRLDSYLTKLEDQRDSVIASVNVRQSREPKFVRGFMQEEQW